MKSLADLEAIRNKTLEQVNLRKDREGTRIVVGMATCGIAAGARPVLLAFVEEVKNRNLPDVIVSQTGCIGMCRLEPIVEVYKRGEEKITYVKVTPAMAHEIMEEHIANPSGKPLFMHTLDYAELQKHAASHPNITLEHRGVWSGPAVLPMLYSRDSSSVDRWGTHETKTQTCSFIDIDTYFSMKHERCDFLKMDIEGAELEALRGAEQTLRRYRPKLAISVYHSPLKDFLHIPKFISELGLEYEFFLGHHTPYWYETILYCKPCS